MPIKDLLRPDQLAALKRLRKRIANRTAMRRYRADPAYYRRLCAGVDLPIEAGTCGRLVNRSSGERCYRCWQRRQWLLNHAMTPYEIAVAGTLADELEHDVADREREDDPHTDAIVPARRRRRPARTRRPVPFSMTFAPMIAWRSGRPPGATDRRPVPSSTCRGFVPRRPSHR